MNNPSHPGEIIREDVIEPLGLSVSKAAEILGVRCATLSDVVNAKASVSAEMALRLEKPFGGFKQSGIGRDLAMNAMEGYTELKNVYVAE